MSFDPVSLLVSFLISGVGFVLFVYGRRMGRMPQVLGGIVLMLYPYFVSSVGWLVAIGVGIVALIWLGLRAGL